MKRRFQWLASTSLAMMAAPAAAQALPPASAPQTADPQATDPQAPPTSAPLTQTTDPSAPAATASAQDDVQPASATPAGDIVVTGSRVIRNGDASPSPVTVISTESLSAITPGATLAEALNTLPAFAGSRGAASNPTTVGSAAGGNGSANQLNLRNLGATRTLVLLDGKRVPPTLFNGVVDVDIIPEMLIERVDVVTGGVSAVYGSDAMSGVVNYVLNRRFKGLRVDASSGISEYGDASRINIGAAYGVNLTDRLHFEASYQFRDEGGVDRRSSRPFLNQVGVTGAGTAANPYVLGENLRQAGFPFGGRINTGALAGQVFKTNGVLSPFVAGTTTGTAAVQIGGDGGYWDSSLIASLREHQAFARADYEISDGLRLYVQASGTFKTNGSWAETNQLSAVTLSRTNAFLPAQYQAAIPAAQSTFTFSKFLGEIPRVRADSDSDQRVYAAGLAGTLGGFDWGIDYVHGISELNTAVANVINRQKLSAALDAVNSGGQVVCNITVTNPGLAPGCVAYNPFGPNAASAAAIDYVTDTVNFRSITKMDDVSGQIAGSLFNTWAGPANTALSAEWRKTSFQSFSSSRPSDVVSCTGLRYNCTAGAALTESSFGDSPDPVSQTVWEVAGEIDVPLLRDFVIADALNLNGAVRYTRYNTSGDYWTWKLGLDWHLTDSLRFRVTRSRDIRAPTLYDLFSPTSIVVVRQTDLLTGQSPSVPEYNLSNPDLTAEIGNTLTGGVVWKPAPRLSFAVDAYRIKISDAITQIAGSTASYQTACYASGGTSPYCALQVRPLGLSNTTAANAVTAWLTQQINIASIETWGIDVEENYAGEAFGRPVSMRLLVAYQPHVYYRQPNTPTLDQGGVGFGPLGLSATPSVRITGQLRVQPVDGFTIDVQERWRNPMKLGGDPTQVFVSNRIGAFATTTINLAWDAKGALGDAEFFINVQNLFDAEPPAGAFSGNGTRAGLRDGFAIGDDPRGRYFTSGVRLKF